MLGYPVTMFRLLFSCLVSLTLSSAAWAETSADDTVKVRGDRYDAVIDPDRPSARTTQKELEERQPQSTPAALTFSPGVYVQQTAHGQGSPYIRGRTGQQTLLLFDGLRLNHALFRKGPNQYLFTVDARTLSGIDVIRGSASVELGNDAISGAVYLRPLEPAIDPTRDEFILRPTAFFRAGTADGERGGRLQLNTQLNKYFGILLGVGGRTVGQLEAGGDAFPEGQLAGQSCQDITSIPCFEADGRTQKGTGFDELTGDARAVYQRGRHRFTLATYVYRQYDAPRTDQCPPPEAALGECLNYDEQFRTHAYAKWHFSPKLRFMDSMETSISYQRQHQRYTLLRPDRAPDDGIDTTTINGGRDGVDGIGAIFRAGAHPWRIGNMNIDVRYGIDSSFETIDSVKWIQFAQPAVTRILSRGQYVDGATYDQVGVFLAPALSWKKWRARTGIRVSHIATSSPGDEDTASPMFDRSFQPVVANAGLRWGKTVAIFANIEQGFRAPNLDDLTARQSTGQGYQLENSDLKPERALTAELGLRLNLPSIQAEILVFDQRLDDAIERRLLTRTECQLSPEYSDRACRANRAPLQLINLDDTAVIRGAEAKLKWRLPNRVKLTATLSYAHGEGPNPSPTGSDTMPLSRIPPLNGTGELGWYPRDRPFISLATRWATRQERLSVGDVADARIPSGGTPGYQIFDLRTGVRYSGDLVILLVFENLTDMQYKTHGSGVYGAGRSFISSIRWDI